MMESTAAKEIVRGFETALAMLEEYDFRVRRGLDEPQLLRHMKPEFRDRVLAIRDAGKRVHDLRAAGLLAE
jgi:hypothetical protein